MSDASNGGTMVTRNIRQRTNSGGLTRRQVIKAGGLLIPASAAFPGLLLRSARAATAQTFDYYISPTGSDSNPGTLNQPWAITAINTKQSTYAGKRLGLIAGKYDVSRLMQYNPGNPYPALVLNGGPNSSTPTYIGSSDASGSYLPRAATLDAKGASGYYGGGNALACAIMGQSTYGPYPASNWGNWIVDGLVFTGFSTWGFWIGNYDGSHGAVPNPVIKNCEFAGGNASQCTVASGINLAPVVNFTSTNALITNNYIHDNIGPGVSGDSEHFSAVYIWGLGATGTTGFTFTYNTVVASGNVHQKETTTYNSEVAYNYIDMTGSKPLATAGQNAGCLAGWGADGGKGTLTRIHHNILVSPNMQYMWLANDTGQLGWYTPGEIYNNTCVASGNQTGGGAAGFLFFEMKAGSRVCTYYNNLFYDGGYSVASSFGYVLVNTDALKIGDYNIYGGKNYYTTIPAGAQSGGEVSYSSLASYQAAVNAETHSTSVLNSGLTNTGVLARQYQVQAGSAAYQTGRVGGISSGAVCNVGAWDGVVGQIGCDFAEGQVLPDAPQLNSVS